MGPFSLLTALHKAGFAQYLHVIGETGLGKPQILTLQHAGAFFAAAQPGQDGKALCVGGCVAGIVAVGYLFNALQIIFI